MRLGSGRSSDWKERGKVTILKCLGQQGSKRPKLLYNYTEMTFVTFAFITVLTFGFIVQKQ